MPDYRVTWEIDITADNPRAAAELARNAQTREGTTAVVFDVFEEGQEPVRVDLEEDEGWEADPEDREIAADLEQRVPILTIKERYSCPKCGTPHSTKTFRDMSTDISTYYCSDHCRETH